MNDFNWEEFKKGTMVVHCNTKEKCEDFINKCKLYDINFNFNSIDEYWYLLKEDTCFVYVPEEYNYLMITSKRSIEDNNLISLKLIEWEIL